MEPLNQPPSPQMPPSTPTPPPTSPMPQMPPSQMPQEHKKVGPVVVVLIIVLVLVVGALYFFAAQIDKEQQVQDSSTVGESTQNMMDSAQSQSAPVDVQPVTGTSDSVSDLEADLNAATAGIDTQNF